MPDFTASPADQGTRLDHFLAEKLAELSRSRVQSLVKDGHILLNNVATRSSAKLKNGDQISITIPAPVSTAIVAEEIPLAILFEDVELIVLNKPPGLVVHPAVGNESGTLVNALLHHCHDLSGIGGEQRPGIVHRLDKDTSGCLVVAKNDHAHQQLSQQFAGRTIEKIYLALVASVPRQKRGSIHAPIGRHPVNRQKMAVVERGRAAHTDYEVLQEFADGTALIACTLHTGRTHQIRVHLQHLGHPLLGDAVYGRPRGYPRQMLHAWKLGFDHPRTGERLRFTAPIPPDFPIPGS
jgi:23S rRNA pseudouridine1911/1915/1917 synthase